MKLSEVSKECIASMPFEEKCNFICGDIVDDGMSAPVALLLGGNPNNARPRAIAAAELYKSGRVPFIVPSGGVKWDVDGEQISESHYMKRILMENGVPEEAIILENQATTTKENMIHATLRINRKTKLRGFDHIIIVTSETHMKRSIALAKALLPRKFTVSAYPTYPEGSREAWLADPQNLEILDKSILLMKDLVDEHIIEDMEISL